MPLKREDAAAFIQKARDKGIPDEDIKVHLSNLGVEPAPTETKPTNDNWFGPGGAVPSWMANHENVRGLVKGSLEQLPVAGAVGGGAAGAVIGLGAAAPTGFLSAPVTASVGGVAGSALGSASGKGLQNLGEHYLLGEDQTKSEQVHGLLGSAKEGALAQGYGEVAAPIAKAAFGAAKNLGAKGMSVVLGPSEEAIKTYIGRADQIKNAKSVESIKDQIDQTMAGLFDAVEKSNMTHEEAKGAFNAVEGRIKEAAAEASGRFADKKFNVNQQLSEARQALDRSFGVEKEKLSAIKSPIHIADDVQSSIADLKKSVIDESKKAYEILGKQKGRVDLSNVQNQIEQMKDSLFTGEGSSKALLSADAEKAHAALEKWQTKLNAIADKNGTVALPTLKGVVQEIDRDMGRFGNRMNAGEFNDLAERQMYGLRKAIDSNLKALPEYTAQMENVAKKADLLSRANETFGDAKRTVSKLNQIGSRTAQADRDLLNELGLETGKDFKGPVGQFTSSQGLLKNPGAMETIEKSLPEWKQVRLRELEKEQLSNPNARDQFVDSELGKSGLLGEKDVAKERLSTAEAGLLKSKDELEPFRSLNPSGTQNAVKGLMKVPGKENIELRRKMQALSDMSGKDFLNWINDRRIADQFQGEYRIGSRNVALGGAMGGMILGPHGITPGMAVGGVIDRYGPKIAQKILDGIKYSKGPQLVEAIEALEIPREAKTGLLTELSAFSSEAPMTRALPKAAELDRDSSTPANYKVEPKGLLKKTK